MSEERTTEQLIQQGREAFARHDNVTALTCLREATRREPAFADVHNLMGLALSLLGEPTEAVEAFDRAVEINPRYVEALVNRAIVLNELGRYAEARASFEAASEADVEDGVGQFPGVLATRLAQKHEEVGDLYAEGGAFEEAVGEYRRAAALRPRFVDIRTRLARALLEMGRVEEAAAELASALATNPAYLEARILLGLTLYRLGDVAGARLEWERGRRQRPGHPQVESFLAMLERGAP